MADKEKKERMLGKKDSEPLIETLPDGRHRTNLDLLIRTAEAQQHFKEISKLVKKEKPEAEVK